MATAARQRVWVARTINLSDYLDEQRDGVSRPFIVLGWPPTGSIMQQGLSVDLDLDTPPGRNVAWIAVRDNHNGYVGTLQAAVGQ